MSAFGIMPNQTTPTGGWLQLALQSVTGKTL
jgi:hypothetical protein